MKLPKARTENLLEQNLENETLIYDLLIDKAFNLNETLSVVYKACGRNQTFDDSKRENKFTDDFIYLALDELKRENLLVEDYQSPFAKTNRREVIKKVGLATMFALPVITGLIAPNAANAASNCVGEPFLPVESVCYNRPCTRQCVTAYCTGDDVNPGYCCSLNTVGRRILISGQTYSDVSRSPTYFPEGTTPTNSACPYTCCDGTTPSGGCTYALFEEEDFDPPTGGFVAYRATCNCSC